LNIVLKWIKHTEVNTSLNLLRRIQQKVDHKFIALSLLN